MESEIDINGDTELLQLLSDADPADVSVLVDFLTDSGKGRLSMASEVRAALESAKRKSKFSRGVLLLLIRELQHYGGNSIVNLFRRNGVPYAEIVADVLSHVGGTSSKDEPVASLELKVLEKLLSQAWEKMSPQEQADFSKGFQNDTGVLGVSYAAIQAAIRRGGPAAVQAALLANNAFARLAMGGALAAGANIIAGRAAGLAFGPVGAALTGIAGAHTLASQAYRVTVPCVVQIAYIRQKNAQVTCPACHAGSVRGTKFCSECGTALVQ